MMRKFNKALKELEENVTQLPAITARERLKNTLHQLADDLIAVFDGQRPREESSDIFNEVTLSKKIGVPKSTLTHWRMEGRGPKFFKVGKSVYYRGQDIKDWANSQKTLKSTAEAQIL